MDNSLIKQQEEFERKQKIFEEARAVYEQAKEAFETTKREDVFKLAQKAYDQARAQYLKDRLDYIPFKPEKNIPAPPLVRAAYSDRMAWIMANMARMAYIGFDKNNKKNREEEEARLRFCLQSGKYEPQLKAKSKDAVSGDDDGSQFELVRIFDTSKGEDMRDKRSFIALLIDLIFGKSKATKTDTQAFLAKCESFAVLSFRGTQPTTKEDVLTDLAAVQRKTEDGEVHVGFKKAFDEVKDEIRKTLPEIGNLPLYITGHSLGAALATVATQEFEHEIEDHIAACYTFGSPRVGDGKFEKSIKVPFYRIVHTTDIITVIPWFFGAYVHVGDERYISRKGKEIQRNMRSRFGDWLIESFQAVLHRSWPLTNWIGAHDMDNYVERLEEIALARKDLRQSQELTKQSFISRIFGSGKKPAE